MMYVCLHSVCTSRDYITEGWNCPVGNCEGGIVLGSFSVRTVHLFLS